MNQKKTFTFLVVSNQRGRTSRVIISSAWLKAILALGIFSVIVFSATFIDYLGLLIQSNENKRLRVENNQLTAQFALVEGKLLSLESGLERLKRFSTKLKVITDAYGVQDKELHLAMGPLVKTGHAIDALHEPVEDREDVGQIADKDSVFFEQAPLDLAQGELSIKGVRDYASLSIRIDQAIKGVALQEQGVIELWSTLSEKESQLKATPSILPVRGWVTPRFGFRVSPFTDKPLMHSGLDIAAAPGTEVRAPADGVISYAGFDAGYGMLVSIDHGYGYVTRFGHNSRVFVSVGKKVKRGDVISTVGNTGRSTGPHLHYEVRVGGLPVNPANFILED